MFFPFSRLALFVVSICGWAATFCGGWIAVRGAVFYDWDAVLMGTGGGIALGGLLVTVMTIGAQAQIVTARDTAILRGILERGAPRSVAPTGPMPGPPSLRPMAKGAMPTSQTLPKADGTDKKPGGRSEPRLSRKG